MSITGHDVARVAGVSQSTVSRALRGDERVSPATRERVLRAVSELRYVPSEVGRSLVTRSTRTIGIVVTDVTSVFYPYLIAPLHEAVNVQGYRMVLFTETSDGEQAEPLIERLLDRTSDGVVLTTSRLDGAVPRLLAERSLPFVFLSRYVDEVAADGAVVDNSLGAALVAGEALRLGHARFAGIFGPENTSTGRDRERGTRAALAAASMPLPDDAVRHGPFSYEYGHSAMIELMSLSPRPSVVICGNDTIAIGAFNAIRSLGLDVPGDVSLTGFDDLPMAAWDVFGLTTVHQPMEEMARTAVQLLIDRIDGAVAGSAGRQKIFEPRLVIRRSLGPAPA